MKGSERDYKSRTILKIFIQFICHSLVNASSGKLRIRERPFDFQREGGYMGKFEINELGYNFS